MVEGDANGFTKCVSNSCGNDDEASKVMGYIISKVGFLRHRNEFQEGGGLFII